MDRGRAIPQPAITFNISASVSPASGADLQRLPEGRRSDESVTVFTSTPLKIGGQSQPFEADVLTIDGRPWEVSQLQTWHDSISGSTGYKAICLCQVG